MYLTNGRVQELDKDIYIDVIAGRDSYGNIITEKQLDSYPKDKNGEPVFRYWYEEDWDKAYNIARATWSKLLGEWLYYNPNTRETREADRLSANPGWEKSILVRHEKSYWAEWCVHFFMKIIAMDPYKAFTSSPYERKLYDSSADERNRYTIVEWNPQPVDWNAWTDFCKWYLGYMKDFVNNVSVMDLDPENAPMVLLTNDIIHGNPGRWYGQFAMWRAGNENLLKKCLRYKGIKDYVDVMDYDLRGCKATGSMYQLPPRPNVSNELNMYISMITNPALITSGFVENVHMSMNDSRKPFSGNTYVSTTRPEILTDDDVELIQGRSGSNWYLIGISVALGAGLIYMARR